jgi:hypothetical protein
MLRIEFKKGTDQHMLICTRKDGSVTWMQADRFFIIHDLTHYVVEKTLNFRHGFYGLVAGGLNITDFEDKQKFKPREMPLEAIYAENLVLLLMTEFSGGEVIREFQKTFNEVCLQSGSPVMNIDPVTLDDLRSGISELTRHWESLPAKKSIDLNF